MEVINTLGRRKSSVARVYMQKGSGKMTINGRDMAEYFPVATLHDKLARPFELTETAGQWDVKVNVKGGGLTGQVEAIRMAVGRALVKENEEYRAMLKVESILTRDPRMVERKKFGQKKARKKFQFSKR